MLHRTHAPIGQIAPDPIALCEKYKLVDKHDDVTRGLIGAWRWPGIWENRKNIYLAISQPYVIDFGGSAGPIGYNTIVVDYEEPNLKTIFDLPGRPDAIFTAHTLEHVEDIDLLLACFHRKIRPKGQLIALVPSWKNEHLQHRNWPYHRHTFRLGEEPEAPPESECFRELVEPYFPNIFFFDYTGKDHILVIAEKEGDI